MQKSMKVLGDIGDVRISSDVQFLEGVATVPLWISSVSVPSECWDQSSGGPFLCSAVRILGPYIGESKQPLCKHMAQHKCQYSHFGLRR